jgi:predicted acyl esterase
VSRGIRHVVGVAVLACAFASATSTASAFDAHGSAEQVYATGVTPGTPMALLNGRGRRVATRVADAQGGLLFRDVRPGSGYRVRATRGGASSPALTVFSTRPAPPSTDVYNQTIPQNGYGYMTTRDGTKLAYYVHPPQDVAKALPNGALLPQIPASGATPTLIEYAGYGYANPAGPQSGISVLANLMGFTVVDVNMRGTGCSGGAFDFFEPLQNLDGYDLVETVARQPWVTHNRVGMMGISYGGISQLFTAQLRPPSLAAISPLSVIDATQTTLYPGGILNTGFAFNWAKERAQEARPAGPRAGQGWAYKRIQEGDQTCKSNQAMHGQAADLLGKVRENSHYKPSVADPLSPVTFVDKINVPVYMACQWTDEQTGGHCPTLASRLTGTTRKWITFTNGTHVDSLSPEVFNRWYDFLQLYVAKQAPAANAAPYRAAGPVIYDAAMGISNVMFPPDPIQDEPTYDGALAAFEKLPPIRVLFDNGAGGSAPGQPLPAYERSFASWPVPGTKARSWYLGAGGALADAPATGGGAGANSFTWNPKARPPTNFTGDTGSGSGGLWTATPPYKWVAPPAGSAASYVSAPLSANTTVIGAGALHAWVRSSRANVDLQATISEVRPDGKETFVQGGWLRANERKLDARQGTLLEPVLSLRARDVRRMPRGRFAKVVIPLYYQGHAYRSGSRIRVTISAPNGDQPIWSFDETQPPHGSATVSIAFSKQRPSRLILPVVPGLDIPTALPPCPGLRGEPCRDYRPYANRATK